MFDDEIAAQQQIASTAILEAEKGSKAAGNFGEVRGVLHRRGHKQTRRKKMTERKERPYRGQERSEIRGVKGLENQATMEDIRGLERQSFPLSDF